MLAPKEPPEAVQPHPPTDLGPGGLAMDPAAALLSLLVSEAI